MAAPWAMVGIGASAESLDPLLAFVAASNPRGWPMEVGGGDASSSVDPPLPGSLSAAAAAPPSAAAIRRRRPHLCRGRSRPFLRRHHDADRGPSPRHHRTGDRHAEGRSTRAWPHPRRHGGSMADRRERPPPLPAGAEPRPRPDRQLPRVSGARVRRARDRGHPRRRRRGRRGGRARDQRPGRLRHGTAPRHRVAPRDAVERDRLGDDRLRARSRRSRCPRARVRGRSRRRSRRVQVELAAPGTERWELLRAPPRTADADSRSVAADRSSSETPRLLRDPAAWQALREQVLEPLLRDRSQSSPLRVWVASSCAGDEAYSLAMVLAEAAAGLDSTSLPRILASEVDVDALAAARRGVFSTAAIDELPAGLRQYFTTAGPDRRVADWLRETIVFARHDLFSDAPFSHLDLIVCRDLLSTLDSTMQARALKTFHGALNPGGTLFLGARDTTAAQGRAPVVRRHRSAPAHLSRRRRARAARTADSPVVRGRGRSERRLDRDAGRIAHTSVPGAGALPVFGSTAASDAARFLRAVRGADRREPSRHLLPREPRLSAASPR